MIEHLFGSKTRVKLLHLFYSNPNRSFYVREITRKIDEQINSVRRELSNLLKVGIIRSDMSGNRLYYEVNQEYTFYEPLRQIFSSLSEAKETAAVSTGDSLADKMQDLGSVDFALLTGSFVRNRDIPVDILIVGDVNRNKLDKLMAELEEEEGRQLHYTVMDTSEYKYRRGLNDRFLTMVLGAKHTVVIDRLTPAEQEQPPKEKVAAQARDDEEETQD